MCSCVRAIVCNKKTRYRQYAMKRKEVLEAHSAQLHENSANRSHLSVPLQLVVATRLVQGLLQWPALLQTSTKTPFCSVNQSICLFIAFGREVLCSGYRNYFSVSVRFLSLFLYIFLSSFQYV